MKRLMLVLFCLVVFMFAVTAQEEQLFSELNALYLEECNQPKLAVFDNYGYIVTVFEMVDSSKVVLYTDTLWMKYTCPEYSDGVLIYPEEYSQEMVLNNLTANSVNLKLINNNAIEINTIKETVTCSVKKEKPTLEGFVS
jgi:hypothetical protein